MTLSAHRRMALIASVNRGPTSVRQMSGSVILRYDGDLLVNVVKSNGRVGIPFDPEEAQFLESLGVARHAREAIARGEGIVSPQVWLYERRKQLAAQVLEFKRNPEAAAVSD